MTDAWMKMKHSSSHCPEYVNDEEEVESGTDPIQVLSFNLKPTQQCDVSNSHSCEIVVQAMTTHRKTMTNTDKAFFPSKFTSNVIYLRSHLCWCLLTWHTHCRWQYFLIGGCYQDLFCFWCEHQTTQLLIVPLAPPSPCRQSSPHSRHSFLRS